MAWGGGTLEGEIANITIGFPVHPVISVYGSYFNNGLWTGRGLGLGVGSPINVTGGLQKVKKRKP